MFFFLEDVVKSSWPNDFWRPDEIRKKSIGTSMLLMDFSIGLELFFTAWICKIFFFTSLLLTHLI